MACRVFSRSRMLGQTAAGSGDFSEDFTLQYLHELRGESKFLASLNTPGSLRNVHALVDAEIQRVSTGLRERIDLEEDRLVQTAAPQSSSGMVKLERKLFIPSEKYPNYNFIGRILGPRGTTVKQMEQDTGCDILVRGRGSIREEKRERNLLGKRGWEHLAEPLHILVRVEDETRAAERKIEAAAKRIQALLTPNDNDENKKKQLIELAIINGTYRPEPENRQRGTSSRHFRSSKSGNGMHRP